MIWFIGHKSALEYWRKALVKDALVGKRVYHGKLPNKPPIAKELRFANPWGLSMPLHILVGSKNARKATGGLECHICSEQLPSGSLILAAPGLAVSSPELCFLQMANEFSLIKLIMLGFELCGTYRLDPVNDPERGFRDDQPLTTVAKLDSFVDKAIGLKGRTNARRALQYIADNAASPRETALTLLLTLPYRLGGYGFPLPLLNCRIDVKTNAKRTANKTRLYCDLYWPDKQVDVEYDSDAYHAKPDRIARDAIRRNALISVGVTVITVSRTQIINTGELRKVAEVLSKLLGKRLQYPKKFLLQHALLRKELFA